MDTFLCKLEVFWVGVQAQTWDDSDYNKSNRLFQEACDGGDTWGCNNLGLNYQFGYGVIRDIAKALALYRKACLDGLGEACENLRRLQ